MQQSTKANLFLLLVAIIWGVTFPLIRNAISHVDPFLFVTTRFFLGALILLPFMWNRLKHTTAMIILSCFIIGFQNAVSYASQTIGLETIPSARSAFITGLAVVLVPLIAPLFKLGSLRIIDVVCSLICLVGLYILTGAHLSNITIGDKWTLLCALSYASQIIYIQYIAKKFTDYHILTFYQLACTIPFTLIFTPITHIPDLLYPSVVIAVLFCTIFATTLAYFIQAKYQRFTTAPKAALIFSLEPVFACFFGYLINGEAITRSVLLGGALILSSFTLPIFMQLYKKIR